jgi:hypothetical protein
MEIKMKTRTGKMALLAEIQNENLSRNELSEIKAW